MEGCAARDDTWISPLIIDSYCTLHSLGMAHSVETWRNGKLVGGLYGVALGGAFFGESMFHTATDASKVALQRAGRCACANAVIACSICNGPRRTSARSAPINIPRSVYLDRLDQGPAAAVRVRLTLRQTVTRSPTRMTPSLRNSARRPPRCTSPRNTPLPVSRSRCVQGSHNRQPSTRTWPTRNSRPTRSFKRLRRA